MKIPGYNTIQEAAERTGRKPATLQRYCGRGKIKAVKVGWTLLISDAELERYARETTAGRPKSATATKKDAPKSAKRPKSRKKVAVLSQDKSTT
jgi:excisionase family DNA binding protein